MIDQDKDIERQHARGPVGEEVLLTQVEKDHVIIRSRRLYPLYVRFFLHFTAPAVETVRSTGIEVYMTDSRKLPDHWFEYDGYLSHTTPALLSWLEEVKNQGARTPENQDTYTRLHLDQRACPRVYCAFQVVTPDLEADTAITCDISRTGIRLLTRQPVPPPNTMRLRLDFDSFDYPSVCANAEVLWCVEKEPGAWFVGLRFIDLEPKAEETLASYIDFAMMAAVKK